MDADPLVAAPNLVGEPECAEEVDVALDRRFDLVEGHAPGGGDVADPGGETGSQGVEEEFDRSRRVVSTHQNGRMVGVVGEGLGMLLFSARPVVRIDPAAAVSPLLPGVDGPELELGELRLRLDDIDRCEQRRSIFAVHRLRLAVGLRRALAHGAISSRPSNRESVSPCGVARTYTTMRAIRGDPRNSRKADVLRGKCPAASRTESRLRRE